MADGKKYFVLMEGGKDTTQVFASKQPRGAALKAATRGHTDIKLRSVAPSVFTTSLAAFRWSTSPLAVLTGFLTRSRRPTSRSKAFCTSIEDRSLC